MTKQTIRSLAKYETLDEASRVLALVPAARSDLVLDVFYDMTPDVGRELIAQQPLALAANLVSRDSTTDDSYLLALLSPAQAAKSIIASAVTDDGQKPQEFLLLNVEEAQRLIGAGLARSVKAKGGAFWWAKKVAMRVSEDTAFQMVCLVLTAKADIAWKAATLNELGSSFIALAAQSTIDDGDISIADRVRAVDDRLAAVVADAARWTGDEELIDDVLEVWEGLVEAGDIVSAQHQNPDSVKVSDKTIGDLVDEIK